jgi:hypothetical protein
MSAVNATMSIRARGVAARDCRGASRAIPARWKKHQRRDDVARFDELIGLKA